ncbi:selenide, water dikinase SelD [Egicoccus halophilus]|uniref:Selenide, water dikinase n=1 Tax=Egicoccus halophilus TaxID=1670830 RepID=A0A8J3ABV0_9ACTN|nr:selenide, water dikinase SelD [Egicoccus halophilus]GGI08002.1 selenide, water dikinase [Egicoccus halophilus]
MVTDAASCAPGGPVRLTAYSHGAGCACKLSPTELGQVMAGLTPARSPDLIVGREHGDDALVWRRPDGRALVATIDVFTPIVDDAATWGRIAAVNAGSDVFAMGGRPLFGLAFAAWPRERLPLTLLTEVLEAGQAAANDGGWVVAGGHTIDGAEPLYGQAVVGELDPERMLRNTQGRPGDTLVLTKPLGTGLVTTAVKRRPPEAHGPGGELAGAYAAAVAEMTRSNGDAAQAALACGTRAGTDVTGFGLLNHLREVLLASGVAARLDAAAVPRLPGVADLLARGEVPGGTQRNLAHVRDHLELAAGVDEGQLVVLADAQTSGGLLLAVPARAAAVDLVAQLTDGGHTAAVIGELTDGPSATIQIVA